MISLGIAASHGRIARLHGSFRFTCGRYDKLKALCKRQNRHDSTWMYNSIVGIGGVVVVGVVGLKCRCNRIFRLIVILLAEQLSSPDAREMHRTKANYPSPRLIILLRRRT